MVKIDDKTNVPLGWLLSALGIACGGVWVTATFVGRISDDVRNLQHDVHQINKKLKIEEPDQASTSALIPLARADNEKQEKL